VEGVGKKKKSEFPRQITLCGKTYQQKEKKKTTTETSQEEKTSETGSIRCKPSR